ncbi:MAG: hypothetical protein ACYDH6_07225 [Acidimicrobiales bacterium]
MAYRLSAGLRASVAVARLRGDYSATHAHRGDDARLGYASSYPAAEDLYLPVRVEIDPDTGTLRLDDGQPVTVPWALLLRRDDIDVLEFLEASAGRSPAYTLITEDQPA